MDNVQYKKNDWQNRNRIQTAQGRQWLTVPVQYRFPQKINEVTINNTVNWKNKHLQSLVSNYSRAPFFKKYAKLFEEVYSKDWVLLSELNIALIERLKAAFGLDRAPAVKSSELSLRENPTKKFGGYTSEPGWNKWHEVC